MSFALLGIVIGFLVAAPVGPVAVLCVHRTLLDGRLAGYATGVGAALGDTLFGALAVFSVAYVESALMNHRPIVQAVGGVVLIGLGLRTIFARTDKSPEAEVTSATVDHVTLVHACVSAFAITAINPITILAFISIFAAVGVSSDSEGLLNSWALIAGVLVGALAWWSMLASLAASMRQRFTARRLRWLNIASGVVILGFGLYGLAALAWLPPS
jgi:threonine/homoserine/homoserine lactone efflux protein